MLKIFSLERKLCKRETILLFYREKRTNKNPTNQPENNKETHKKNHRSLGDGDRQFSFLYKNPWPPNNASRSKIGSSRKRQQTCALFTKRSCRNLHRPRERQDKHMVEHSKCMNCEQLRRGQYCGCLYKIHSVHNLPQTPRCGSCGRTYATTKWALVWNGTGSPTAPLALLPPGIRHTTRLGHRGSVAVTQSHCNLFYSPA